MKKLLLIYSILFLACSLFAQDHYPVPFRSCTKWGFVEYGTKKKVTNFEYDTVSTFSSDRAWVKKYNLYGYVDEKGGLVIPIQYDDAFNFGKEAAQVRKNDRVFFIDRNGKEVESEKWRIWQDDYRYMLPKTYKEGGKYGLSEYAQPDNRKLTPAIYDSLVPTYHGAFALKEGKWGIIGRENEILTDFIWDEIIQFRNVLPDYGNCSFFYGVSQKNKWALVSPTGKLRAPYKYQGFDPNVNHSNLIVKAKPFNADWGFIDIVGTEYFEERGEGCLNERIDFTQEMQLSANPNPFSDAITAYFQLTKEAKTVKISLSDLSGKIIYEEVLEDLLQGKHEYTLHPKDLSVGIYVLHIDSKEGGASLRVQKY